MGFWRRNPGLEVLAREHIFLELGHRTTLPPPPSSLKVPLVSSGLLPGALVMILCLALGVFWMSEKTCGVGVGVAFEWLEAAPSRVPIRLPILAHFVWFIWIAILMAISLDWYFETVSFQTMFWRSWRTHCFSELEGKCCILAKDSPGVYAMIPPLLYQCHIVRQYKTDGETL